jgi:hypothetical protein
VTLCPCCGNFSLADSNRLLLLVFFPKNSKNSLRDCSTYTRGSLGLITFFATANFLVFFCLVILSSIGVDVCQFGMNYFLLTLFESVGPEALWSVLGRKPSQLFGKECGGSAIWMFFSLIIRSLVTFLGLRSIVPNGVIFALPICFQVSTINLFLL